MEDRLNELLETHEQVEQDGFNHVEQDVAGRPGMFFAQHVFDICSIINYSSIMNYSSIITILKT